MIKKWTNLLDNMKRLISICTLLLFLNCKEKVELPIISATINELGEKEIYRINNFYFTNQFGEDFGTQNTIGNIYIANFFFTSCPSICPPMRNKLIDIATTFKDKNDFIILSFTIDPANDTVSVLKKYATSLRIPNKKWFFLRGTDKELLKIADKFRTSFSKKEDSIDFYHSSFVALVDKKQQIRGFYNILDEASFEELKEDIQKLK